VARVIDSAIMVGGIVGPCCARRRRQRAAAIRHASRIMQLSSALSSATRVTDRVIGRVIELRTRDAHHRSRHDRRWPALVARGRGRGRGRRRRRRRPHRATRRASHVV